jgi:DNA-binding PadR family transcriptional regulator
VLRGARGGYVSWEKRSGKTRERTFYTLTAKGRKALRRWAAEPPAFPRIQNDAVLKLICGHLFGDDEKLLEALLTLRDEIEAQHAKREEARQRYEAIQHRKRYLLLNDRLGTRLLQVQREWIDEVERELRPPWFCATRTRTRVRLLLADDHGDRADGDTQADSR